LVFSKTDDAKEYERELRLRRRRLRQEEAIRRDSTHQEIANNEE
jgi:phage-related minor tail protein